MKEKNEIESKLTIYYDEPFWAGVFERIDNGKLSVCKVTFGAEPTDAQVWEFVLANYRRLQFSVTVKAEQKQKADNPKRRQRNARKQMESSGIGTKSQQALQKQYEENKTERKRTTREQREADIEGFVEKLETLYPDIQYVNQLMTHSWGQTVIRFYDLDGNLIEVGTPMK